MTRFVVLLLIITLLFSCEESNQEEVNKYKIISLLYDKLAEPSNLIYEPNFTGKPYAKKDTVRMDSLYKSIQKKRVKSKYIVAVYPQLVSYTGGPYKYYSNKCADYDKIMDKLILLKDSTKIDLEKIISNRNDSIISFSQNLIVKNSMEFVNFDLLMTFSPIAFDEEYKKAIIVTTKMRSKSSGSTDLYILEKENNQWEIECEINLGIY